MAKALTGRLGFSGDPGHYPDSGFLDLDHDLDSGIFCYRNSY